MTPADAISLLWLALTVPAVLYAIYDLVTNTPEIGVMKWGWVAVIAYTGIVGLVLYLLSCREPLPGTHERFVAPRWKQAVGSTIHCLAGDATGIIAAAAITATLGLPMGLDLVVEYVAGFLFGLLIFQALFMKDMLGGGYRNAVRRSLYPEWLSMNAVMAGMIPVMVVLMTADMRAMERASPRFLGRHVARDARRWARRVPGELVARGHRPEARHGDRPGTGSRWAPRRGREGAHPRW